MGSSPATERRSGKLPSPGSGAGELALAEAAAGGDGDAFAALYDTYEKRVFNFCLRLLGSTHDAEDATQEAFVRVLRRLPEVDTEGLEFGAYLFTAARNASYDMIDRRKKAEPTDEFADDLQGHLHRERADADTDPERAAMIATQQLSVQEANERLPERQREVLALRELEEMSYDEIASVMDMKQNAVAQLISRARIRLRAELTAGAGRAVAPAGPDCERALPLIAMRQDGQAGDPADRIWLDTHIAGCASCQVTSEEMAEAGVSYRAWAPVVPAAWLFRESVAKASEVSGADWSGVERPEGQAWTPAAGRSSRRTLLSVAGGVAVVTVLMAAFMAGTVDDALLDPLTSSETSSLTGKPAQGPREGGEDEAGVTSASASGSPEEVVTEPTGIVVPSGSGDSPAPRAESGGGSGGQPGSPAEPADTGSGTETPTPTPTPEPTPPPTTSPPPTTTPPPSTTPPSTPPTPPPGGPGPSLPPGGPGGFSN